MSTDTRSKFAGALLGCAIGDALGAPCEGLRSDQLARMDVAAGFRKIPGYPLGQYTDDTQLTMALAETYAEKGCFDGELFGKKVARLWESREIVGAGGACSFAAHNLINGISWKHSGAPEGQAGNGSAMRASPTGLFRAHDTNLMLQESMDHSRVTHKDVRAGAGAAAVAFAVAWNLKGSDPDPERLSADLAGFIGPVHEEFAGHLRRIPEWLEKDPAQALTEMACAGWIDPPQPIGAVTPFVIPTVLVSLWAFLQHPDDYAKAVERVIKAGGDVDTTGAITGAITGARVGEEGLPRELRRTVLDSEGIRDLARALQSGCTA